MFQIETGFEDRLTMKQVQAYAERRFPSSTMKEMREVFEYSFI
jgi:hypothetical protein